MVGTKCAVTGYINSSVHSYSTIALTYLNLDDAGIQIRTLEHSIRTYVY